MGKTKRVTPYKQRGKAKKKDDEKLCAMKIKDVAKVRERIETMTEEELARVQKEAAQKALNLFSKLMDELTERIPDMNDEVLATSLLSVWDKIGNKK